MAGRLVYSTDPARQPCPRCKTFPCECPREESPPPPAKQSVVLRVDRKGRRGKSVTLVEGFIGHPAAREDLARRLKAACGAGGAVKGVTIEIQGEKIAEIARVLESLDYRVTRR